MERDRRGVLRAAGFALLAPGFCALPLRAQAPRRAFAPPSEPMIYTRRLERSLAGGARFRVSRSFAVHFQQREGGYWVEGEQVGVEVEAPEALAEFADLERQRVERTLFPLTLDTDGLIAGLSDYRAPQQLEQAVQEVLTRVARLGLPEEADAARFASAVHVQSEVLVSALPIDLFAPLAERDSATRTFDLPGGAQGQVSVLYTAEETPGTGLMRSALREVVTQLDGVHRRTAENWTLVPHG